MRKWNLGSCFLKKTSFANMYRSACIICTFKICGFENLQTPNCPTPGRAHHPLPLNLTGAAIWIFFCGPQRSCTIACSLFRTQNVHYGQKKFTSSFHQKWCSYALIRYSVSQGIVWRLRVAQICRYKYLGILVCAEVPWTDPLHILRAYCTSATHASFWKWFDYWE